MPLFNSTKAFSSLPLRQTDDSSDEENEINLAQEIALSHSNSEQLESRDLPREQIKSPEVATEMVCEYSFPEQDRTTDSSTLSASLSGTQSLTETATLSASQSEAKGDNGKEDIFNKIQRGRKKEKHSAELRLYRVR
ncbi:unnamed protein product [Acanthoscelides obtectus]|uniref:Uncharacterized protein n=1 Tax=Acanthoscelides obtectus TaxID=200917 RepID=A0A9P0KWP9_ACAOB|nr:unnamed protein product [Acanthoscelides obtectus]CAK1650522.1 hypothetical protein AOBTE_LOCUS16794 [Acanthoscelides obtectus]